MTLRNYLDSRNQILILRLLGGLGDIFMHRMLFEDFKKAAPGISLHFACPVQYHDAVSDHPFLDKILDCSKVNLEDYRIHFNTSMACGRYETKIAPKSDLHRSDIWASHCGFNLKNHEMHFNLSSEEKIKAKNYFQQFGFNKKIVCLAPRSAMGSKDLSPEQTIQVANGLKEKGFEVFGLHSHIIPELKDAGIPQIVNVPIREWMAIIDQSDAIISVDTAAFHCAGGMKKPLIGIFSWADGKVYGKYFDFILIQKHRDHGNWDCGPCYNYTLCPKSRNLRKPCITEISSEEILFGFDVLNSKYAL